MKKSILFLSFIVVLTGTLFASPDKKKHKKETKKSSVPAALRGCAHTWYLQDQEAKVSKLTYIDSLAQLEKFKKLKLLVPLTKEVTIVKIPQYRQFVRDYANLFLNRFSNNYQAVFGTTAKIPISSAVRTIPVQDSLTHKNPNAAKTHGKHKHDTSHRTGATIDMNYALMTPAEKKWCEGVLISLGKKGVIIPIEETNEPCFHIMVCKSYIKYAAEHPQK
jgi:uncharacterized protein DUF5715